MKNSMIMISWNNFVDEIGKGNDIYFLLLPLLLLISTNDKSKQADSVYNKNNQCCFYLWKMARKKSWWSFDR